MRAALYPCPGGAVLVRPQAVAFDVIETLMALEPIRARLSDIGQPEQLLEPWYTRTLRDGLALSVTGEFQPFPVVAKQALSVATAQTVEDADLDYVLAGFRELAAYQDVEPAMRKLADGGVRMSCLTNGTQDVTARFLERAGLDHYVERVVTVDQAGAWKPVAAVYRVAAAEIGVELERMMLVAAHDWDCHGAKHAGCMTGWVARGNRAYGNVFAPADLAGTDLVDLADRILELPEN